MCAGENLQLNVSEIWTLKLSIWSKTVPVVMKPYKTIKSALVQKTNRRRKTSQNVCTKFPVPIVTRPTSGKTGGKFRVKLQEHRTEVEYNTRRTFPRSPCASSLIERNKSTLTDHTTQENHVINWSQATVIDREPERFTRWIKEAIHIRKEGHAYGPSIVYSKLQPSDNGRSFLLRCQTFSRVWKLEFPVAV